ncbi:hypothetical protein EL22_15025 [Halostagnicola sp. A56]|nr:hypothetical protein EL22_15025 [Halostagnicola sp. A56]
MISNAVDAVVEDPDRFRDQYDHLLVDEFQDVSLGQIELLQAFTDGDDAPHLFCVGDDWQSIYGFRGAVIEYFVDFEEYFGSAAITELEETYRCLETVLEASTDLIANNADQIDKDPIACSGRDTTPRVHTIAGTDDRQYAIRVGEYAATLVEEYLEARSDPNDVMILSRYDSGADFVNRVTSALEDRGIPYDGKDDADSFRPPDTPRAGRGADDGGVSVFSAHQAKGREAPHVILLHVAAGADGFSPDVRNDELLDLARDVRASEGTEERCLFYVAVTRSESTLDLLTRSGEESVFLEEIGAHVSRPTGVADPGRSVRKSRLRPGLGNCGMRRPRARHTRGSSRTGAVGSNSSRGRTPPHRTYKSMLATA